ncbi:hypothetical protein K9L97_02530 [Candidatus Woesearchaeota archaeon]|nr:hypothetical protein [Candidatus Woesearchaeota archaeon]
MQQEKIKKTIIGLILITVLMLILSYSFFKDIVFTIVTIVIGIIIGTIMLPFWSKNKIKQKIKIKHKEMKLTIFGTTILLIYLIKYGLLDFKIIKTLSGIAIIIFTILLLGSKKLIEQNKKLP